MIGLAVRPPGSVTAPAAADPGAGPVPDRVGRYRPEALLGTGGSAHVYRARDPRSGRSVALKRSRPETDPGDPPGANQRRVRAEGEVLRTVACADVVGLLDQGDDDDASHLVLDLADGGTLGGRLRAGRVGDPWQTARVGGALRGALEVVHAHGLVHRDVQPANLLIRSTDAAIGPTPGVLAPGERLLLADLGIATPTAAAGRPAPDRRVGTRLYRAPEQVTGDGRVTGAADLYGATAVIVSVLSASLPPPPERVAELVDVLRPRWQTLVRVGMHPDPAQRFASADDWHGCLVAALDDDLRRAGHRGLA